jgi:ferredoxin
MNKIDPSFAERLKKYGAVDINACYNCGNCTAICPLSDENNSFPRKMLRASVLGIEENINTSLDPWMCYYCGECSETCPREAEPGELMMTLRRWLIAKYDWTGLSGLLFRSVFASISMFVIVALAVITFAFFENFNNVSIMHFGHLFEMFAILSVFAVILLPNIIHMWVLTVLKSKTKVKLKTYFQELWELIVHMFVQKRTLECENKSIRWFEHFILVFAYLGLLFTTVFLDWFGTETFFIIALGYAESIVIFIVTAIFIFERLKQTQQLNTHSHSSDWLFVIWLSFMGLTAFLVRLFVDLDLIENNLWLYLFHLIILAQWALIIVPFGKWTHFLYRSFAMYFNALLTTK